MEEEKNDPSEIIQEKVKMNDQLEGKPATLNKYDRQIRLWGSHGQKSLMETKILLIGGDLPGVETLKNLVLPGVGSIHIMDHKFVTKRDVGSNFFTPFETQGKLRAKVLVQYLSEMNSDVKVFEAIIKDSSEITKEDLTPFTFVIINQQAASVIESIAKICEESNIQFIIQKNYGFFGYLRLFSPDHTIIEGKIQSVDITDIRLNNPFQALKDYEEKIDLDSLEETEHSHMVYPVILLKELKKWKEENNDEQPKKYAEKQKFKEQIRQASYSYQRKKFLEKKTKALQEKEDKELTEEKISVLEETSKKESFLIELNYEEAIKNSIKLFVDKSELPGPMGWKMKELFEQADQQDSSTCSFFWLLTKTLHLFWNQHQKFPLIGTIPDMRSLTEDYLEFQKMYQEEAKTDRIEFEKLLVEVKGEREKEISDERITLFLKNSQILSYVKYRSYSEEVKNPNPLPEYTETQCDKVLLTIKGLSQYEQIYGKMPENNDGKELLGFINCTIGLKFPKSKPLDIQFASELSRYENCQLNQIASLMGGIASQEIIKLITHQYIPVNNTLIFNGITSEIETFEL